MVIPSIIMRYREDPGDTYCRVSHTGDAIRVMYSSVRVGVVHVLCACAQVQSTV